MRDTDSVDRVMRELIGLPCENVDNPYGSILRLDLGPLGHRATDGTQERPHGWRHLTVESPWRLEGDRYVICDWNFSGGKDGDISRLAQTLIGHHVLEATAIGPGWDLDLRFSGGLRLVVFADSDDGRDDAWMILGTDDLRLEVGPVF